LPAEDTLAYRARSDSGYAVLSAKATMELLALAVVPPAKF